MRLSSCLSRSTSLQTCSEGPSPPTTDTDLARVCTIANLDLGQKEITKHLIQSISSPIIERVRVIDIEKLRLVMPMVANLLILGNMSMRISSTVERHESPRNVTKNKNNITN